MGRVHLSRTLEPPERRVGRDGVVRLDTQLVIPDEKGELVYPGKYVGDCEVAVDVRRDGRGVCYLTVQDPATFPRNLFSMGQEWAHDAIRFWGEPLHTFTMPGPYNPIPENWLILKRLPELAEKYDIKRWHYPGCGLHVVPKMIFGGGVLTTGLNDGYTVADQYCSAGDLPFEDGAFDATLLVGVGGIPEMVNALPEFRRTTKPDGLMVTVDRPWNPMGARFVDAGHAELINERRARGYRVMRVFRNRK